MSRPLHSAHEGWSQERRYIAIIGDIVSSRKIAGPQRRRTQTALIEFLAGLNRIFHEALVADFTIVRGDEFEALLPPMGGSRVIPELVWDAAEKFQSSFRFGIGLGTIETEIDRDPRLVDGSAFHNARQAIERAGKQDLLGGVFAGFGDQHDAILNGIARLLDHHRQTWTKQQRRLAELLRQDPLQINAASRLGISRQAVSAYARNAGWEAYVEGETAWRRAIEVAVVPFLRGEADKGMGGAGRAV
jgi:SatD family (SatD)